MGCMDGIVWWEIETADPERFQQFHAALSGWSFEPGLRRHRAGCGLLDHPGRWPRHRRASAGVVAGRSAVCWAAYLCRGR
ncbi:hypothetical protein MLP_00990 [Microlunatus phosphovorus NM-1]|uniref:Uncharacterized protein n=1 Tax=Microlunatus phosphovorus (strain ATCC 700054 / DSM 10555 / JCM 9379 / NBRC 101784 / NCIMB 13414 / VKM Ac-1990 / NM-1) TaxID=1032480 RepID=F5XGK6_MICPN|nr:hypothetical protein MLP_00990 [Microlunatus phosphovorus NM-1]